MCPDTAPGGTAEPRLVALAEEIMVPPRLLNSTRSFAAVVWKLVPVTVTLVPLAPMLGVKDVIVGAPRSHRR